MMMMSDILCPFVEFQNFRPCCDAVSFFLNTNSRRSLESFLKWQIALLSTWHFNRDILIIPFSLGDIFYIAKKSL